MSSMRVNPRRQDEGILREIMEKVKNGKNYWRYGRKSICRLLDNSISESLYPSERKTPVEENGIYAPVKNTPIADGGSI